MRPADRLFQIIQLLRRGRIVTAQWLAETLEVSQRTIYRDVADLIARGVPIDAEAGVGYSLSSHYDLPPLQFTQEELEALVLGARLVKGWGDASLSAGAQSILDKVAAVMPGELKEQMANSRLYALNFQGTEAAARHMAPLRLGIREQYKVELLYEDARERRTKRLVRPLALSFLAPLWMLTAWCELRGAFRNFRLDRIIEVTPTQTWFALEAGKRMEDFLEMIATEASPTDPPSPSVS
ncbi:YafY family transcriptional regulator [Myxococcota bacterium]|nr:YafY family transcriptional regulator [Myxococcota bacterium]MBU1533881.1 YafY family transcriptional regulator [Myxococcota bacterium]